MRRGRAGAAYAAPGTAGGGSDGDAADLRRAGRGAGADGGADHRRHTAKEAKASAIVTARKPGKRYSTAPEITPEEHQRRGDVPGDRAPAREKQP